VSPLPPHLQAVSDAARTRDRTSRAADDVLVQAILGARRHDPPYTLQDIADVMGISRQAVQQLLARVERRS
jgi:Mn-dependent DtxR family transcriptional regulator